MFATADSDMQFEILRNMKQKSGAMFGVSKEVSSSPVLRGVVACTRCWRWSMVWCGVLPEVEYGVVWGVT